MAEVELSVWRLLLIIPVIEGKGQGERADSKLSLWRRLLAIFVSEEKGMVGGKGGAVLVEAIVGHLRSKGGGYKMRADGEHSVWRQLMVISVAEEEGTGEGERSVWRQLFVICVVQEEGTVGDKGGAVHVESSVGSLRSTGGGHTCGAEGDLSLWR
ncbi:hypothetical protein CYMTET_18744 [Cymbomonas tetramitiformis]|uniref:Uncharacterized protein n=1 Tax=Cymbomonas tetramitiformis TaxID=36881 RepID=A0AAE0G7N8_9CHLO|nr:hypothetical protein CYMTET_18744 [Cymbomonas tetramitiformis]